MKPVYEENPYDSYSEFLQHQKKDDLAFICDFLDIPQKGNLKKADLVKFLEKIYTDSPDVVLSRLPRYELEILSHLIEKGKGATFTLESQMDCFFSGDIGIAHHWEDEDENHHFELSDKMFDYISPYIGAALEKVKDPERVLVEDFFWGCITIYGSITIMHLADLAIEQFGEEKGEKIYEEIFKYPGMISLFGKYITYPGEDWVSINENRSNWSCRDSSLLYHDLSTMLETGKTAPFLFFLPTDTNSSGHRLLALLTDRVGGKGARLLMQDLFLNTETCSAPSMIHQTETFFHSVIKSIAKNKEEDLYLRKLIKEYTVSIPLWQCKGRSMYYIMDHSQSYDFKSKGLRERLLEPRHIGSQDGKVGTTRS